MSTHYPRIRIRAENGSLLVREGLRITFYMRHSHGYVLQGVERSLETYLRAVGPRALGWYINTEGEEQELDDAGSVTVEEMTGDRAVVTMGEWPEAGDMEKGQVLPAYRELARVLEPWLYFEPRARLPDLSPEETRRWDRRFLDATP